eukprot:2061808-Rhodomonas_salina.5
MALPCAVACYKALPPDPSEDSDRDANIPKVSLRETASGAAVTAGFLNPRAGWILVDESSTTTSWPSTLIRLSCPRPRLWPPCSASHIPSTRGSRADCGRVFHARPSTLADPSCSLRKHTVSACRRGKLPASRDTRQLPPHPATGIPPSGPPSPELSAGLKLAERSSWCCRDHACRAS